MCGLRDFACCNCNLILLSNKMYISYSCVFHIYFIDNRTHRRSIAIHLQCVLLSIYLYLPHMPYFIYIYKSVCPQKHLCYSVLPFFWFKPQFLLNITPREQLGWGQGSGAGRSGAQVLFPESRELTSQESQTSPRMMPCFKSDW